MDEMQLISINTGRAETISHNGKSITTGICKYPVKGPVSVDEYGLQDDVVTDTAHHGGADQALYAYSEDDYAWWRHQRDRDFAPGMFGENLTVRGLPSDLSIGDRLLIGDVLLEATAPRIPCSTFAMRMQDTTFGFAFKSAERPGVYFRVLNGGVIEAGDSVIMIANPDDSVTLLDLFRCNYDLNPDPADLRRYVASPIAERMRQKLQSRLASCESAGPAGM